MAKKYSQQQYGGLYQGSAQSAGFQAEKAIDLSGQFKQKGKEVSRDLKTQSDHLSRVFKVQNSQLSADKTASAAQAKAFQGLLGLAGKTIDTVSNINKIQEKQAKQDAINNETTSFLFGSDTAPIIDGAVEQEQKQSAMAQATGIAAQQIEIETGNPALAEDVRSEAADAQSGRAISAINTHEAAARIGVDLSDYMISDTLVTLPDGRQILARDAKTSPELAAVAAQGVRELSNSYGLQNMDPQVLRSTYLESARNAYNNSVASRGAAMRAARTSQQSETFYQQASAEIQAGTSNLGSTYQNLYNNLRLANASSDPTELNQLARQHIIAVAKGMGLDGIGVLNQLRDVEQVPGNKGSKIGMGRFAADIDAAERAIRSGEVTDYRTMMNEQGINVETAKAAHQRALLQAKTEEERVQLSTAFEDQLKISAAAGNQAALQELQAQRSLDNRYNPNAMGELMDRIADGGAISRAEVEGLRDSGTISPEEAEAAIKAAGSNIVESVSKQLQPYQKGWEKQMGAEISAAMIKTGGASDDRAETAIYAQDATRILNERMNQWIAQNPNSEPSQIQQEAKSLTQEIVKERVSGDIKTGATYNFDTPQVPTEPYLNPFTGRPARNLQNMTTTQLQALMTDKGPGSADNDINIYSDILLTQQHFRKEIERMQTGQDFSPRVKQLARIANVTPKALMYGAAVGKGVDLDSQLLKTEDAGNEGPTDLVSGVKYLQGLGFTARGSAYLSANIMQESSWQGMRDWGQVMGDGTSRNGGLISWASWANDPARLGTIENYLGKPISQATHAEQLKAMTWEMQRSYPDSYRTFTNPSATDAQLRRASKAYWGYGHEGDRFGSYLTQALDVTNG